MTVDRDIRRRKSILYNPLKCQFDKENPEISELKPTQDRHRAEEEK